MFRFPYLLTGIFLFSFALSLAHAQPVIDGNMSDPHYEVIKTFFNSKKKLRYL
jgi:hypothetical protein